MSGLDQEFQGRVRAANVDATTPEAEAVVKQLEFRNHGLVVRSAAGDVLFKQPDHEVEMEQVRAKLRELLGRG